ncbi:aminoglycoside phosphotransferase family protein [Streptomycetaceae bacterium NBC_01309]
MTHASPDTGTTPRDAVPVCRPLDIGDNGVVLPTDELAPGLWREAMREALASPRFDGGAAAPGNSGECVVLGKATVAKVQRRAHERLDVLLEFDELRRIADVPAPALLDHGAVDLGGVSVWWTVLERARGDHGDGTPDLLPSRQRAVARVLRRWHAYGDASLGPRLDDPGMAGLFFGEIRARAPGAARRLAAELDAACRGAEMTAVHGDAAVGHNVLFRAADVTAVLDPGAVRVAPPMLCLGWTVAVDLGLGGSVEAALTGYAASVADRELLHRVLPLLVTRRLADVQRLGDAAAARHLGDWLASRRPDLLELAVAGSGPGSDRAQIDPF